MGQRLDAVLPILIGMVALSSVAACGSTGGSSPSASSSSSGGGSPTSLPLKPDENPTQRRLFTYPPNSSTQVVPDLAAEVPTTPNGGMTDGGRTVTVHIQHGVHFSPPVNREVTSGDKLLVAHAVAIAGFFSNQPNIESSDVKGVNDLGNSAAGISPTRR